MAIDEFALSDYDERVMSAVLSENQSSMIPVLGKCVPASSCADVEIIKTFANKQLEALWNTGKSKIDARLHRRIIRRLNVLDDADALEDLNLSGFNFHGLHGYSPKRYTIHVNGPWCITFEFREGDAFAVDFEQYH